MDRQSGIILGRTLLESQVVTMVRINEEYFNIGWDLLQTRPDKNYSFTECTSFTVMHSFELNKALAYDHRFVQMGFTVNQLFEK
ncbi:MAG: hypothetical protein ACQES4_04155 [Bacillota bacterium]